MHHKAFWIAAALCGSIFLPLAASGQPKAQPKATAVSPQQRVIEQRIQTQAALQGRGKSDIDPASRINVSVSLFDDGTTLTIAGYGYGFDKALNFVSLIYADPSASRGALACLPPTPNPYTPQQMFVAYWLPVGSSERALYVQKTGAAYTPLANIGTMSVRYDSQFGTDPTLNQNPGRFFLQSCGRV